MQSPAKKHLQDPAADFEHVAGTLPRLELEKFFVAHATAEDVTEATLMLPEKLRGREVILDVEEKTKPAFVVEETDIAALGVFAGIPTDLVARIFRSTRMTSPIGSGRLGNILSESEEGGMSFLDTFRLLSQMCKSFRALLADSRFFPVVSLGDHQVRAALEAAPGARGCHQLWLHSEKNEPKECGKLLTEFTSVSDLTITGKRLTKQFYHLSRNWPCWTQLRKVTLLSEYWGNVHADNAAVAFFGSRSIPSFASKWEVLKSLAEAGAKFKTVSVCNRGYGRTYFSDDEKALLTEVEHLHLSGSQAVTFGESLSFSAPQLRTLEGRISYYDIAQLVEWTPNLERLSISDFGVARRWGVGGEIPDEMDLSPLTRLSSLKVLKITCGYNCPLTRQSIAAFGDFKNNLEEIVIDKLEAEYEQDVRDTLDAFCPAAKITILSKTLPVIRAHPADDFGAMFPFGILPGM